MNDSVLRGPSSLRWFAVVSSFQQGTGESGGEGVLTAAFDGMHGWFWRNRTDQVVTITLRVEGDFEELREM